MEGRSSRRTTASSTRESWATGVLEVTSPTPCTPTCRRQPYLGKGLPWSNSGATETTHPVPQGRHKFPKEEGW